MKRFLPYILILVVLVGLFSPIRGMYAQDTNYQLLAPLPCPENSTNCIGTTFNPSEEDSTGKNVALGKYLNLMIKVIIGLSPVMAVVMIVIGGMEYMTSELISSKEAGKEKIRNALLGLLIALGAYALLFTINPNLLRTDVKIDTATVEVTLAEAIQSDTGKTLPIGPITGCTTGMQRTTSGMFACGDGNLAQNINNMISTAATNGINLTGGGYRSLDEQKALRIKNCKGDYTSASAPCNPDTALPGLSNHNNGKAFDLKCDGTFIQTADNKCFVWLKTNAGRFGLTNLASEPWHWSVDGR